MNAERLLAIYDRVVDAPDAVPRLRRFILDLAVRGKLVEQDPHDEPALELLKRLDATRDGIQKNQSKNYHAPIDDIFDDNLRVLPLGWLWVPLARVCVVTMGQSPPGNTYNKSGDGVPLINGPVEFTPGPFGLTVVNQYTSAPTKFCEEGDLLICVRGSTTGRTNVAAFRACIGRGVAAISSLFDGGFIRLVLWRARENIIAMGRGIAFPSISKRQIENLAIPLPPLAEQRRIVSKVEGLMALCDQLEKTQNEREQTRDRLTKSSYARLTTSDTDETFQVSARFVANALPALTARADQIKQLRQTILDLAVRGKLVERDPNDEPASELLKRIEEEKIRLVKAGMTRKGKKPPPVEDSPTQLPNSWCWTQIAEVGLISPRNDFPDDHIASFVPMSVIPAEYGTFNSHEMRQWGDIKKGYTHFAEGDVGLAKITPCFENGKSVVFRNLAGGIGSGTTELHVVRPIFVDADYIVIFLKSPHFIENGILKMTGTAGQKRVSREYFANSPFPLPPLPEQRRIVAKVDELMLLCDQLEANLSAGDNGRNSLLESLLRDVLYPVVNKPNAVLPSILPIGESHF